jgi:hypothetical protein
MDFEAIEMAMRSALHQAGEAALTELLKFDPPGRCESAGKEFHPRLVDLFLSQLLRRGRPPGLLQHRPSLHLRLHSAIIAGMGPVYALIYPPFATLSAWASLSAAWSSWPSARPRPSLSHSSRRPHHFRRLSGIRPLRRVRQTCRGPLRRTHNDNLQFLDRRNPRSCPSMYSARQLASPTGSPCPGRRHEDAEVPRLAFAGWVNRRHVSGSTGKSSSRRSGF